MAAMFVYVMVEKCHVQNCIVGQVWRSFMNFEKRRNYVCKMFVILYHIGVL